MEAADDIQVQRLADAAGLLGAVHDGDLGDRFGNGGGQLLGHERAIQANLHQTDLLAVRVQVIDDLFGHVADGAHSHDDAVGIRRAIVVEEVVVRADLVVDLLHAALDDRRERVVVAVAGLAMLEEDVAVLVRAAHGRMLRVERMVAERLDGIHIAHIGEVFVVPCGDLLHLMRGAEAVEEVQERDAALDRREMRDGGEIHDFLNVAFGQHAETGLAARHDVGMVAEDVQGLRGHGTGAYMENGRKLLGRDLIHIRNHEEQALGRRVGGGQRACGKRAVHGARRAALALHLDYLNGHAKEVFLALRRPDIGVIRHRRARRDRIDARDLGEGV